MRKNLLLVFSITLLLSGMAIAQSRKTYTEKKNGFSVAYPADFTVLTGKKAKIDSAFGDPGIGSKLVAVSPKSLPRKYHGDYQFNIWRSLNKNPKCGAAEADEQIGNIPVEAGESQKTRSIGGNTFSEYFGSEGGMSKSLGLHGYRGLVNGKCWMIQSVTYQVSAYDDYKPFDEKNVDAAFAKFLAAFKFSK